MNNDPDQTLPPPSLLPPPLRPPPPPPPPSQQGQPPEDEINSSPSKRQRVDGADTNNGNDVAEENSQGDGGDDSGDDIDAIGDEELVQHSSHCLSVNLFGVFCTSEKCTPLLKRRGSDLWIPSAKVLRQHWAKQICYDGGIPNAKETHRSLKAIQIRQHSQLKRGTAAAAAAMVQSVFPRNCNVLGEQFYYCVNCGAFDKKIANMRRHFGVRTDMMGCSVAIHMKRGTVCEGLHGMRCPAEVVQLIQNQKFILPYPHADTVVNQPNSTPAVPTGNGGLQRRVGQRRTTPALPTQHYSEYKYFFTTFAIESY